MESDWDAGVFVFGAVGGVLYEIEVGLGSLSDSIVAVCDADGYELAWNDDRPDGGLASRLFWRAPVGGDVYVGVSGYGEGSYTLTVGVSDIVDEYSNQPVGAAGMVGESVEGVLEHPEDVDYFVFGAVWSVLYEIEVRLGSLSNSAVAVHDSYGVVLAWNDDYGDSLAPRLVWKALGGGDVYVEVSGYGEGSYTLTVGVSDVVDDYADGVDGAARVGLREAVDGVLEYADDVFVFGAEEGVLYEIEVTLGTLSDSVVEVYDSGGVELAWNDDDKDSLASRIEWRAPAGGDYFIEGVGLR